MDTVEIQASVLGILALPNYLCFPDIQDDFSPAFCE